MRICHSLTCKQIDNSTPDQLTATFRSNPATLIHNSTLPIDCLCLGTNLITSTLKTNSLNILDLFMASFD